jgi:hypothetical protein
LRSEEYKLLLKFHQNPKRIINFAKNIFIYEKAIITILRRYFNDFLQTRT